MISSRASRADWAATASSRWKVPSARSHSLATRPSRTAGRERLQPGDVGRVGPLRGEHRAGAAHGRVVVAQVPQLALPQPAQPVEQRRPAAVGGGAHERAPAATAPGPDQPRGAQHAQRLAHGHGRHAEAVGELGLGGQQQAVGQDAEADRVGEPAPVIASARPAASSGANTAA